jgi:hypothetical protein
MHTDSAAARAACELIVMLTPPCVERRSLRRRFDPTAIPHGARRALFRERTGRRRLTLRTGAFSLALFI